VATCPRVGEDYYGQDGTYRISVPTYTATADTMTDSVTGLTWQRNPDSAVKTQAEAVSYCADLSLAGHEDWRLPSRLEFVSLFDVGRSPPAVPPSIASVTTGRKWTSTPALTTENAHFLANDRFGAWTVAVTSDSATARCVRGPALSGALQVGTETVIDSMTGLEWQRSSLTDTPVTWKAALAYCEALTHASKTDWRLPSVKELATIVDESDATAPVINATNFGSSTATFYWSSTPVFINLNVMFAFALLTDLGTSPSFEATTLAAAARCVRQAD
jgi:hypothetical protein